MRNPIKIQIVVEPWPRQVLLDTRKLDRNSTGTRQELDRIALDSSTKLDSYSTDLDSYSTETRPPGPRGMRFYAVKKRKIRNDCGLRRAHRGPAPGVGAVRAGPSGGFSLAARACNNVNAKRAGSTARTAVFDSTRIHQIYSPILARLIWEHESAALSVPEGGPAHRLLG